MASRVILKGFRLQLVVAVVSTALGPSPPRVAGLERVSAAWTPAGWRGGAPLDAAAAPLLGKAPLVFAGEVRQLRGLLAGAAGGDGVVLVAEDCSGGGAFATDRVRDRVRATRLTAIATCHASGSPVVEVLAAPETTEAPEACYRRAAMATNLVRAFAAGGYGTAPADAGVAEALRFARAIGAGGAVDLALANRPIFTCRRVASLDYEEALTRQDSTTGRWYGTSAHLLAVDGDAGGQVLEYARGLSNPFLVDVAGADAAAVAKTVAALDPLSEPGRVALSLSEPRPDADDLRAALGARPWVEAAAL